MSPARWDGLALLLVKSKRIHGRGTAYPVGPRLLLTARHVVRGASSIRARFAGVDVPGAIPPTPRFSECDATVVWQDERRDVALLEVAGLDGAGLPFAPVRVLPLHDGEEWTSRAFPSASGAGGDAAVPATASLDGQLQVLTEGPLELLVKNGPRDPGGFAGASGGPVVDAHGCVVGVITQEEVHWTGRLLATALSTCFGDAEFLRLVGLGDRDRIEARVVAEITEILGRDLLALERLREVMERPESEVLELRRGVPGDAAGVARWLSRLPVDGATFCLNEAHEEVVERLDRARKDAAEEVAALRNAASALVRMLCFLLPALVELDTTCSANRHFREAGHSRLAGIITLPDAPLGFVDLIVAAIERRPLLASPRNHGGARSRLGIDRRGVLGVIKADFADDVVQELARKLGVDAALPPERRLREVRAKLKVQEDPRRRRRRPRYLVLDVDVDGGAGDSQIHAQAIARLRRELPQLLVVRLGAGELHDDSFELWARIQEMLERQRTNGRGTA